VADFRVLETPEVLDQYPALREDPTNETGRHPIRYQRGGWYTFEIETSGRGLHFLLYQAIEELGLVLVFALVRFHEPLP